MNGADRRSFHFNIKIEFYFDKLIQKGAKLESPTPT